MSSFIHFLAQESRYIGNIFQLFLGQREKWGLWRQLILLLWESDNSIYTSSTQPQLTMTKPPWIPICSSCLFSFAVLHGPFLYFHKTQKLIFSHTERTLFSATKFTSITEGWDWGKSLFHVAEFHSCKTRKLVVWLPFSPTVPNEKSPSKGTYPAQDMQTKSYQN